MERKIGSVEVFLSIRSRIRVQKFLAIHVNDFNKLYYRVYTRLSNLIRIVVTNSTIRQINERVLVGGGLAARG